MLLISTLRIWRKVKHNFAVLLRAGRNTFFISAYPALKKAELLIGNGISVGILKLKFQLPATIREFYKFLGTVNACINIVSNFNFPVKQKIICIFHPMRISPERIITRTNLRIYFQITRKGSAILSDFYTRHHRVGLINQLNNHKTAHRIRSMRRSIQHISIEPHCFSGM